MAQVKHSSLLSPQFNAKEIRKDILRMAYAGNSVHIACAFSIVEILAVLYRSHLGLRSNGPDSMDRDFLVLSKGHGVMAQYACLKELGWISENELESYFSDGSRLKGLSDAHVPGLEVSSGSLGHGFSVGVGLALAAKRNGTSQQCFVIAGDGEMNEGAMWEGILFAAHQGLNNLTLIIDENKFQAMGRTSEILELGSLRDKLDAFGWETLEVDGHNEEQLDSTLCTLRKSALPQPKALIAHTQKGKGVSFTENNNAWHYSRLDEETFRKAMQELA